MYTVFFEALKIVKKKYGGQKIWPAILLNIFQCLHGETSALKSLYGGQITLSTLSCLLIEPNIGFRYSKTNPLKNLFGMTMKMPEAFFFSKQYLIHF